MRDGLDPNKNEALEDDYSDCEEQDWYDDHEFDDLTESSPTENQVSLFDFTHYKTEVRNVFKNIKLFFKRVFMGNKRYLDLLDKERSLAEVRSGVHISTEPEYVDAKDKYGATLIRFTKAVDATIHIDLAKMLRGIGIQVNTGVEWNITGLPDDFIK